MGKIGIKAFEEGLSLLLSRKKVQTGTYESAHDQKYRNKKWAHVLKWKKGKQNETYRPLLFHYPELQCPYLFDKHFSPSLVGWDKFHHPRLTGSEAQKG